jgi:hypothetical protein
MRRRNVEKGLSKLTLAEVEKLFAQLDRASASNDYGLRLQQALLFQDLIAFHRERIESEVTKRLSSQDYRQNPAVEQLFEVAKKMPTRLSAPILNLHLAMAGTEPKARVLSNKSALNYLSRYSSGTSLDSSVQKSIRDLRGEMDFGIRYNWVSAISNLSSTGQGEFLDLLIDGSMNPKSDLYRDHLRGLGSVARNPAQLTSQFTGLGPDKKNDFSRVVVAELRNTKPVLTDEQALNLFATSRIYTHPEGVDAGRKAAIDEMTQMGLPVSKCEVASGPRATCGQVSSRERTAAYLDIFLFGGLPLFSMSEASRGSRIPDLSSQNRESMARALEGSPR